MEETKIILFVTIWPLFALGYGAGIIYGLRFLRTNDLVDTRVPEFVKDSLFVRLGSNYKLFYYGHSQKYGKSKTIILITIHFVSMIMVFALPVILS